MTGGHATVGTIVPPIWSLGPRCLWPLKLIYVTLETPKALRFKLQNLRYIHDDGKELSIPSSWMYQRFQPERCDQQSFTGKNESGLRVFIDLTMVIDWTMAIVWTTFIDWPIDWTMVIDWTSTGHRLHHRMDHGHRLDHGYRLDHGNRLDHRLDHG